MRHVMVAAAAALVLAACGQQGSGGPELPKAPEGAQAPSVQAPSTAQQAMLTPEQRAQLEQLVTGYLDAVQSNFGGGMAPAQGFADQIAGLQPGTDHRWQVDLVGGTGYRVVGACDNECSNMDIELIDARTGGVVASDMATDDHPVVNFTPPANGNYVVRVLMQTCTVAPCFAGARILTGGGGATPGK